MITYIISDLENKKQELIQFLENNMSIILPQMSIETNIKNDKKRNIFVMLLGKIIKREKPTLTTHKEVLSQSESVELYNKIKNVIEVVDDSWKEFLVVNKNILKEMIDSTTWNSEEKTNYSLKAMVTTTISYQMSDILTKIIKFGKETDEKELNNYITELKKELLISIDKAYNEQKLIYSEIVERLNKN